MRPSAKLDKTQLKQVAQQMIAGEEVQHNGRLHTTGKIPAL
jgi:hypothetical protein